MFKVSIERKTNNLDKLMKKLKKLRNASVESGYFVEQGVHQDSEMLYTDLMKMHEFGFGDLPVRPVRAITKARLKSSKESSKGMGDYLFRNKPLTDVLANIGGMVTMEAKSIFGHTPPLKANAPAWAAIKGGNAPLVFTGDLQSHWSWRTSEDASIKTK